MESPDVGMLMPEDVDPAVDKVNKYLRDHARALQDKRFGKKEEKDILCSRTPKHPGNVAYHTKVMGVAPRFQIKTPRDEKDAIVNSSLWTTCRKKAINLWHNPTKEYGIKFHLKEHFARSKPVWWMP